MELWFLAALGSALGSGFSAFVMKIAAKRDYNSEVFILIGGLFSVVLTIPVALIFSEENSLTYGVALIGLMTGTIASIVGIFKVYALRYIDTTIYFPLFKLFGPAVAIVFGIFFFAETFTTFEWVGLVAGMTVPLLLVTKQENVRQNNLLKGVVLVFITGFLAAIVAAGNKYATELYQAIFWLLVFNNIGIILGSIATTFYKHGLHNPIVYVAENILPGLVAWSCFRSVLISLGFLCLLYAFLWGGSLGVVYTIQSFYILIPIVLAIIFYKEHWNLQKVVAIILSVAALALLG